ncbi:exonuclease [uncultured Caudovirales phage]|uniref:Exonuclease n=1 Tax=uncultured Caudovirales phage TaxID=2100421 RepID=A0A6J5M6C8_9CAUD|nr:exonuclease [uncultured Caudovirales phage]
MTAPTLLLDADILAYQFSSMAETPIKWDERLWTLHADEDEAYDNLQDRIQQLKDSLGGGDVVVCLSDSHNFRKDVLPTYKSNRKDVRKPLVLSALKERMTKDYRTFVRPSLEADDVLGILATGRAIPGEKLVVTIDKDLRSVPCQFMDLRYLTNPPVTVDVDEADRWHMRQTLTGDTVDGYAGCPGIGPKRAEGILEGATSVAEMWQRVVEVYAKAGLSEADALIQARVARILRSCDYDFQNKQPKLWNPPQ